MTKYYCLSHPISSSTPVYAGEEGPKVSNLCSLQDGGTCNKLSIVMDNHMGTHVDVPLHFLKGGKCITDYSIDEWVFTKCTIIDCACEPGAVIDSSLLKSKSIDNDCELLLLRTGFERFREQEMYWKKSPIFHEDLGGFFERSLPSLRAIALDTISLSSLLDRQMGRRAHVAILSRGIRIFEDVSLQQLPSSLNQIIAFPLMLKSADGAPVTMMAM